MSPSFSGCHTPSSLSRRVPSLSLNMSLIIWACVRAGGSLRYQSMASHFACKWDKQSVSFYCETFIGQSSWLRLYGVYNCVTGNKGDTGVETINFEITIC